MDMNYKEKQERILDAAFRIFVEPEDRTGEHGRDRGGSRHRAGDIVSILSEQAGAGHRGLYERMEEVYG